MTGFARTSGEGDDLSWTWELKSVNAKGLDLRFRLPSGYADIEGVAREILSRVLKRGSAAVHSGS